ncbi:hypothetical protein [Eubacterium sp.]
MFCQSDVFWNNISEKNVSGDDIAEYIYSSDYLNIQNPTECCEIENEYNSDLIRYFFEAEKHQTEEEYKEIFFQGFLDGDIDKEEYYAAESAFKNLINILSEKSNVYVYYEFLAPIDKNSPFHNSSDVDFDFEFVKSNQGKFVQIVDKFKLEQISVLFAREIVSGYLIFDNIKSALVCSGMHGYILSAEELNRKLLNDISSQVRIEKVY